MHSAVPKQHLLIQGKPVIAHTALSFLTLEPIRTVVIVTHPTHGQETMALTLAHLPKEMHHKLRFTPGGALRQDSVRAGLAELSGHIELVLVHDAARPLVHRQTIERAIRGAMDKGAVIAAVPIRDTVKEVSPEQKIQETLDRSTLWLAQTPQAVRRSLLEQAFDHAAATGFQGTDEASLLEHCRIPVHLVQGHEHNLKITTPEDISIAAALLEQKDPMDLKIGHGYDAHRLVTERALILAGVPIDYHLGLAGHSDADVVCHALSDAILGALGAGDIGRHFPDNDDQYKGISSILLLKKVVALAERGNLCLVNADITIICQRPKLAAYLPRMQQNLAALCRVPPASVNIKATTTEKMGFTGREEGIATHAVVLMKAINAGAARTTD
ncbi:MAG: bifunctional 2-C-methyl-D-erythritol 4-phosphate cytidylyltransferase/2-C-methyl-D-erythritol 2,4-cyclodiphosphate synthase [Desulfobulbus propionicus]|nr:MAG: bifunctional 2-C-methyl-D-erythritol 4-phosphate cytidylyltransferase/2-C-methyl-D-erythritol 2,4-cyclodiphosphate synthase [Desulfobulbus propionicus]